LLVFQPLEEEILEGIGSPLVGKAIIKVLIVRVRFEPEFVRVGEEQSTEEEEEENEVEGGLSDGSHVYLGIYFSSQSAIKFKTQGVCCDEQTPCVVSDGC